MESGRREKVKKSKSKRDGVSGDWMRVMGRRDGMLRVGIGWKKEEKIDTKKEATREHRGST